MCWHIPATSYTFTIRESKGIVDLVCQVQITSNLEAHIKRSNSMALITHASQLMHINQSILYPSRHSRNMEPILRKMYIRKGEIWIAVNMHFWSTPVCAHASRPCIINGILSNFHRRHPCGYEANIARNRIRLMQCNMLP